jgi:predicted metal-dependent phosphoesterase TrpH
MGKADLHIHTIHSWDGTCSVEAVLKQAAHIAKLDVIAITDHDEIQGAQVALELAPRYGIEVIPGCEISTADGHLLALFIPKKIPANLSVFETVLRVWELGGLCIVPHLEAKRSHGMHRQVVRDALKDGRVQQTLLGMETFNAGLFDKSSNQKAAKLSQELNLAKMGSSDSHLNWTIGQGITLFPGHTASELRTAIEGRTTVSYPVKNTAFALIFLSWLRGYFLRRAGWVEFNRYPAAPVRLERMPALARFNRNGVVV